MGFKWPRRKTYQELVEEGRQLDLEEKELRDYFKVGAGTLFKPDEGWSTKGSFYQGLREDYLNARSEDERLRVAEHYVQVLMHRRWERKSAVEAVLKDIAKIEREEGLI